MTKLGSGGFPKQTVLRALVEVRFKDGEALLKTGEPQRRMGAIYVAGYGIECALKARICSDRREFHLDRSFHHHDLRKLAETTALWPDLKGDRDRLSRLTYLQSEWYVTMRYAARPYDANTVRRFINQAREFVRWLFEN